MPRSSNPRPVLASAIELPRQQWLESLERRQLLSATASQLSLLPMASGGSVQGYTPSEIRQAYGFNQISFANSSATANGAGQTIAIVDSYNDPDIKSDLATFDSKFGISAAPSFSVVSQTGSSKLPANNADAAMEISLDVEWAHAIAPGANILLVEASSDSISSLMTAVNYARNVAGVSTISLSWGSNEFSGETAYNSDFTTPSGHTGETFVVASGDSGASQGADWPAVVPSVVSVGGTTLTLSSSGAYESESTWSDSTGGSSIYESEPAYQEGVQTTGKRETPDVSYDANPNTGFAVYDSDAYEGESGWEEVGGTSAGAPQWAALIAIANQGRAIAGLSSLDGASGTLPSLYTLDDTTGGYNTAFHDVTTGSASGGFGAGFGGFSRGFAFNAASSSTSATTGYDEVTGLGSPQAKAVVAALVADKVSITATPNKPSSTSSGSSGSTGSGSSGSGTTSYPPPFRHRPFGYYADRAVVTQPAPAPATTGIAQATLARPATALVTGGAVTTGAQSPLAVQSAKPFVSVSAANASEIAPVRLTDDSSSRLDLSATTDSVLTGKWLGLTAAIVSSESQSIANGLMQALTPHGEYATSLGAAARLENNPFSKSSLALMAGVIVVAAYATQRRRAVRRSA